VEKSESESGEKPFSNGAPPVRSAKNDLAVLMPQPLDSLTDK